MRLKRAALKSGMIVELDVRDQGGRLVLPKGTTLTDRHLSALTLWGIESVGILSPEEKIKKSSVALSAEEMQKLEARFAIANREHPAVAKIFELAVIKSHA